MFYEEIDGVPLKMEMASATGKMVMEVVEYKKMPIADSEISIPSDFKEVKQQQILLWGKDNFKTVVFFIGEQIVTLDSLTQCHAVRDN